MDAAGVGGGGVRDAHRQAVERYYLDTDSSGNYFSATDFILAEELQRQPAALRARFYPFISGVNPPDLSAFTYGEPPRGGPPRATRLSGCWRPIPT